MPQGSFSGSILIFTIWPMLLPAPQPLSRISPTYSSPVVGLIAQTIGPSSPFSTSSGGMLSGYAAALIRIAHFLQRHADQPPRVVFAADEVAFERAEDRLVGWD